MHRLELTNIDKSRVYRPAMNAWSNDKQRFRPPDIRPIVPIESGRASLSQPLHGLSLTNGFSLLRQCLGSASAVEQPPMAIPRTKYGQAKIDQKLPLTTTSARFS